MKKGAFNFSISTLVVTIISIAILIGGVLLIQSIRIDLPEFEKSTPQFFKTNVFPEKGQEGTIFRVDVDFADKSQVFRAEAIVTREGEILSVPLYDDGDHGDGGRDDGIFSGIIDSTGFTEGLYKLDILINPSENEIRYLESSEFVVYKGNCIPLVYNGDPDNKIDVVILPKGYTDFEKFKKDALALIGFPERKKGILTYEPFKSEANKFNFYIVNQSLDLGCEKGCYGIESLVCCDNSKVTAAASQCPADEVFVILDSNEFCGSASSYAKICNGWNHGQVGTHEFGHTFGGLGDEYVYSEVYPGYEGIISTYPNCDVEGCPKWTNFFPGCIDGCGVSSRNRPTNRDCLMYTYTDKFDPVDQRQLLSLLNKYSEGEVLMVAAPPLEKTYFIDLNYRNGLLKTNNVFVTNSKAPDRKALSRFDYFAKLIDFDGRTLGTYKFEIPKLEIPAMPRFENETAYSPVVLSETNYTLAAPYFETAAKMEVYDLQNNKLLTVDLSYLAETCGDDVCQEHESSVDCPADCSIEVNDDICIYERDNFCDADCVRLDPDCGFSKQSMYLILGAAVAAFIILAGLLTEKKKR